MNGKLYQIVAGSSLNFSEQRQIAKALQTTMPGKRPRARWFSKHDFYFSTGSRHDGVRFLGVYAQR